MDQLIGEREIDWYRIQAWMHERSKLPIQKDFRGVARERDDQIVAAFGYDSFQTDGCALHLCADGPSAISRLLLRRAFEVPYIQWQYSYLVAIIHASNGKSLRIAEHLGFVTVGEIPGHLWFGSMTRDQCRWLKLAGRNP